MEPSPGDPTLEGSERIHYLDNLRAVAMLLGVYLHGVLAYAQPSREIWIATDPQGSVAVDVSIWWIHLFRMSLFFLLSGYFSKHLMDRRGLNGFLRNRALRIVVPFLFFWPVLWLAMAIVFVFALSYVQQPEGLLQVVVEAGKDPQVAERSMPATTMHLWFLYYLMFFSLVAACCRRCPKLNLDRHRRGPWLFVAVLGILTLGVRGGGLPVAAPESFLPALWPFAYHGVFYWMGWQLVGRESLLVRLQPRLGGMIAAGSVLFIPHYLLLPDLDVTSIRRAMEGDVATPGIPESILTAVLSILWTSSALLFGRRYLSRSNAWLKFCADGSYWVYLIHLPIVLFLQTVLIPVAIPVVVKLCLVLVGTLLFCFATYLVFVRYTPIGWMLHGKRTFP